MSVAVSNKNSQPGTTWDMYGVKASESLTTSAGGIGSRLGESSEHGLCRRTRIETGSTPEMLRAYYRTMTILSGDLSSGILGPFVNRSQNDIALLNDYSRKRRGALSRAASSSRATDSTVREGHRRYRSGAHAVLTDKLGVVFRNPSYQSISGNTRDCAMCSRRPA